MADERLREALKKDFRKLYVKEFTAGWEIQRLIRGVEIDVMSLDNTKAQLAKADKARLADREKIDEQVAEMMYDPPCAKGRCGYYDVQGHYCFKPKGQEVFCPMADQILPLFNPDAIRREVAEEIIDYFGANIAYWEDTLAQYDKPDDCPEWLSLKSRLGGGE